MSAGYGEMGAEAQDPGMGPDQAGSPAEAPQPPMGPEVPPQGPEPGGADPAEAQGGQGDPVLMPLDEALRNIAMQAIGEKNPDAVKALGQAYQAFAQGKALLDPPADPNRQAGLEEDRRVHEMEHERGLGELRIREQEVEDRAEQARRPESKPEPSGG